MTNNKKPFDMFEWFIIWEVNEKWNNNFITDLEKVFKAYNAVYPEIKMVVKKIPANYLLVIALLLFESLITYEEE